MGEIADEHYDRMWDDIEDDEDYGYSVRVPTTRTCERCGAVGLSWIETDAGWRLGKSGRPHQCNHAAAHERITDDFDMVG